LKAPSPSIKRAEHHAVQQLTTKRATYIHRERERRHGNQNSKACEAHIVDSVQG